MTEPTPAFGASATPTQREGEGSVAPAPAFAAGTITPRSIEPHPVFPAVAKIEAAPAPAPAFAPQPPPVAPLRPTEPQPVAVPDEMVRRMMAQQVKAKPASAAFPQQAAARQPILDHADKVLTDAPEEQARIARRLSVTLAAVPLTDLRAMMTFGVEAQTRAAEVPNRILDLVRGGAAVEINERLGKIRTVVEGISAEDVLSAKRGIINLVRMLAPPKDRLDEALRAVDVESGIIQSHIPVLKDAFDSIEAAMVEEHAARDDLEAHILAGGIVLDFHGLSPQRSEAEARGWEALADRVDALRMSRLANQTDSQQLALFRDQQKRLLEAARSVSIDLVGMWKRNCAAALSILTSPTPASPTQVTSAARGLTEARTKLLAAIPASSSRR